MFYNIQERKNAILGYKKRSSKTRKIAIILKELTHGFCTKMAIFSNFFFLGNIGQEKVFVFDILERKNAFLGYKKNKFKKSKNCHFSKGFNPWFSSKNDHFSNFFFLDKIGQENVFDHILERKNAFLASKNQKIKKSKNWHFSKWVNPWFWFKNGQFFNFFFLGNIGQEHAFYDILERKNAILGYQKRSSKTRKIAIILKELTHGFCTKMAIFPTSFC